MRGIHPSVVKNLRWVVLGVLLIVSICPDVCENAMGPQLFVCCLHDNAWNTDARADCCRSAGGTWYQETGHCEWDADERGYCSDGRTTCSIQTDDANGNGKVDHGSRCGIGEIKCDGIKKCRIPKLEAQTWCEENGGTPYDTYCAFPEAGNAVVWEDLNEDGEIQVDDEVHCESLDEGGNPSGTWVDCETGDACQ